MNPYESGREAGAEWMPLSTCPHPDGTDDRAQWMEGHRDQVEREIGYQERHLTTEWKPIQGSRVEMYHRIFGPGTVLEAYDTWAEVQWDADGRITRGLASVLRPPPAAGESK